MVLIISNPAGQPYDRHRVIGLRSSDLSWRSDGSFIFSQGAVLTAQAPFKKVIHISNFLVYDSSV